MAAQKNWPCLAGKVFLRGLRDAHFRAARVGDKRMRGSVPRNFGKKVDGCRNGQRDVNEVRTLQRCGEFAVERRMDCTARVSLTDDFGAVPAGNANVRRIFAQRQTEGTANQASTKDGDAIDDVGSQYWHSLCICDEPEQSGICHVLIW